MQHVEDPTRTAGPGRQADRATKLRGIRPQGLFTLLDDGNSGFCSCASCNGTLSFRMLHLFFNYCANDDKRILRKKFTPSTFYSHP
jgi:hypothetical protein